MKFTVSSSTLLKQLSSINGVVNSNPVVPILENFLFEIEQGKLMITASDLQTSMKVQLDVEADENGSVAVPARILMDTLKNLPEQPVTFTIDEASYTVEINSNNGHYRLAGENATDFPKLPQVSESKEINLPAATLQKAVSNTLFATSTDELRPAMTGVYLNLSDSNTVFVATDGHRLIRYTRDDVTVTAGTSMIIPRKALTLLKNTLSDENTDVKVEFNQSNAFFRFDNLQMICRLIDERYPDYENVIPHDNNNLMTINRTDLLSSLRRIAIYANKTTHQVRFKISNSQLDISAEDLDFSNEASESLPCEHEGDDIEIGFNARFLIELLSNLSASEVVFKLSAPSRAGLIVPKEQDSEEDILMLVMPIMLNNYM